MIGKLTLKKSDKISKVYKYLSEENGKYLDEETVTESIIEIQRKSSKRIYDLQNYYITHSLTSDE